MMKILKAIVSLDLVCTDSQRMRNTDKVKLIQWPPGFCLGAPVSSHKAVSFGLWFCIIHIGGKKMILEPERFGIWQHIMPGLKVQTSYHALFSEGFNRTHKKHNSAKH